MAEFILDFKDFLEKNPGARPYMATTKTTQVYTDVHYDPDCYIMFGPESRGIPEELLIEDPERCVRIPMWGETRSLNLSNSVAIILYEALRQGIGMACRDEAEPAVQWLQPWCGMAFGDAGVHERLLAQASGWWTVCGLALRGVDAWSC